MKKSPWKRFFLASQSVQKNDEKEAFFCLRHSMQQMISILERRIDREKERQGNSKKKKVNKSTRKKPHKWLCWKVTCYWIVKNTYINSSAIQVNVKRNQNEKWGKKTSFGFHSIWWFHSFPIARIPFKPFSLSPIYGCKNSIFRPVYYMLYIHFNFHERRGNNMYVLDMLSLSLSIYFE